MEILKGISKWMENNLEEPLYQAEMVRVEIFKDHTRTSKLRWLKNRKFVALRPAK